MQKDDFEDMTQPRLATQTEHGRMYARSVGGEPEVPSITTVIGQYAQDLGGWHGYMAAKAALEDDRAMRASRSVGLKHAVIRDAAAAAERYRDQAAARGDRVHNYCENVALRAMDMDHAVDDAREELRQYGESAWADRFDEWWDLYAPEPLAAEVTIWNRTVGYAGTLDLVAKIGGRVCIIDYKTKGTDRKNRVKPLDTKVIMQLVAGVKAEEALADPDTGHWVDWEFGDAPVLLGVALGETEVKPQQANPDLLKHNWFKFCALRKVWEYHRSVDAALEESSLQPLMPVVPPPPRIHMPEQDAS
jgi:hypothetical protein